MEYDLFLYDSKRCAMTVQELLSRKADEGWRIHTFTPQSHHIVITGENHGHAYRDEIVVSILWERER
jgi:hypothetical protein